MSESEEERKSLLMKVKEESEKAGLKLTSWQIDGAKWKQRQTLVSWAPKSPRVEPAAMKLKDTCSFEGKL